jgi:glycosyltransferase involved in cell wall biosynthesis
VNLKSLKLLIIGVGSQEAELKKMVSDLKLAEDVTFTGRIAFSEVSNYFNMLDVLANISDYESFGVSVIEAKACEKPVIATDVGGNSSVIGVSGDSGILVPPNSPQIFAEAIELLVNDSQKRKNLGAKKQNPKF